MDTTSIRLYDHRVRLRGSARRPAVIGLAGLVVLLLASCGGGSGDAADYPDQEITFVVPFAAGGPTDTVTRLIAEPMAAELGQQIVVQNVEGAGGTVAAGQVATAEPDGYTVLVHHIGMSTAPALYPDLPYDPLGGLQDDRPGHRRADDDRRAQGLRARHARGARRPTSRRTPTRSPANAGIGAASHLCGLLFEQAVGVDLTEVPYDGTGPAMTDLVGGQVDFMCDQTTNTTGQIQAGEVKAYAVTTPERIESLPDLPTTAEAGLPDFEVGVWHGLYVPAEHPGRVVEKLTDALTGGVGQDQNVIDRMAELGTAPVPPEDVDARGAHARSSRSRSHLWTPSSRTQGVTGS